LFGVLGEEPWPAADFLAGLSVPTATSLVSEKLWVCLTDPQESLAIVKEEFVALRYLMYIRYVIRHLRNLLGFVVSGFILSVLSTSSYPFQGRRWIGVASTITLVALGIGVGRVLAQLDRDAILSRLTDTKANEVGKTF